MPKPRPGTPPPGAYCTHRRMRYVACESCKEAGRRVCQVACPDCGLTWMFNEGTNG